ncbi:hypothetical protein RP20_CCG018406 [Aedes albopictus]|nr:hypothetical protein RP20_CCG018406 [Aedes albopictus]
MRMKSEDSLRISRRRLLKVTCDGFFLLYRLLQYEKSVLTSSENEEIESSDDFFKMEPNQTVSDNTMRRFWPSCRPNHSSPISSTSS